jgi:hypothetical protein
VVFLNVFIIIIIIIYYYYWQSWDLNSSTHPSMQALYHLSHSANNF